MKKITMFLTLLLAAYNFSLRAQNQPIIDSLLKAINTMPDDTKKVKALFQLTEASHDGKDVMTYAIKYLQLAEKLHDKKEVMNATRTIGDIYREHNDQLKAIEYYQQAVKAAEELKDSESVATALSFIGVSYTNLKDTIKADDYIQKSLNMWERMGRQREIAGIYSYLSYVYADLGDPIKSSECVQKSLTIWEKLGNKSEMVPLLMITAQNYYNSQNYQLALVTMQKYMKLAEAIHDQQAVSSGLGFIGSIYLATKDYTNAESTGRKSLKLAKELNDKQSIYGTSSILFDIYQAQHKYKEALEMNILMYQMQDSLKNIETEKSILKTQLQYEFGKKQLEQKAEQEKKDAFAKAELSKQKFIRNLTFGGVSLAVLFTFFLLRSFNRKKKVSFEKQISDVEMKALRSQMNPHFIFNSLHSINKFTMDNNKESASEYLSKFSKLMRLILENSREQEVSLEKDLSALDLYMQLESLRFQNKFQYEIEVDETIDKENTLIPPLMLQPFVENSIIHGITGKHDGMIHIKINKKNSTIHCTVEDNGVGREVSMNVNSGEKGKSLAINITQERISILNRLKKVKAALTIFDLKDKMNNPCGVRVELTLPLELAC